MHRKRWITGLVALPFLIGLIGRGGLPFALLVGIAALLALGEYFRIAFIPEGKSLSGLLLILALLGGAALIGAAYQGRPELIPPILFFNLFLSTLFSLTQFQSDPVILDNLARQIQSTVYIPLSLACLVLIRNSPDGMIWIFLILGVIFAGDIGAFYVGRAWGRHKLCPSVSPKKTVEGALGGLGANLLLGAAVKCFFLPALSWGSSLIFFLALGAAGQVGDLFESLFKRASGIKDSGAILPGHGGILDRIDALLFAAPIAYFFKEFVFV